MSLFNTELNEKSVQIPGAIRHWHPTF